MRRIAHISDLHFGAEDAAVAAALLLDLEALAPDVVAVSGDLTQRARTWQFRAAADYLSRIAAPRVVVPGNHDIPLYNVVARWTCPLRGYARHVTAEMAPTFADGRLAVAGVNTARSNTWKDGRISPAQVARLTEFFRAQPAAATRVLVAHHPFIPPVADPTAALVGGAPHALRELGAAGCRLVLAGHLHLAYAGDSRPHHVEAEHSVLVVQAGTAISRRRRGEANAFNLLTIAGGAVALEVRVFDGVRFVTRGVERFHDPGDGWRAGAPVTDGPSAAARRPRPD